uniref:Phosducin n=1 Tax=Scleropages formosus TaxID=113540 RepID=A0A8C9R044_SCLFO
MSGPTLDEEELSASHTGPKGVINDWRKFKLESTDQESLPPSKRELLRQMSSPHRPKDDSIMIKKPKKNIHLIKV